LYGVNLDKTNLYKADLRWAGLNGSSLFNADLRNAQMRGVRLNVIGRKENNDNYVILPTILSYSDLRDADLQYADLSQAHLFGADLRNANLQDADLFKAILADDTKVTDEQLKRARNFENIVMFDAEKKQKSLDNFLGGQKARHQRVDESSGLSTEKPPEEDAG
ncbi:MAG: pentapeptide repeat-containing protein, partial [Chloroflexi bacterium]|nr:pentapeptide repeat-containing protein [Chloroflexota bacterium]MCI0726468.1 pentapeptide repeat-containing protein [Chloroflexota bacterium]